MLAELKKKKNIYLFPQQNSNNEDMQEAFRISCASSLQGQFGGSRAELLLYNAGKFKGSKLCRFFKKKKKTFQKSAHLALRLQPPTKTLQEENRVHLPAKSGVLFLPSGCLQKGQKQSPFIHF